MQHIQLHEKQVSRAHFQFIYPFSQLDGNSQTLIHYLQENGFTRFLLNNDTMCQFDLDTSFLALTTNILFPSSEHQKGFQRYTKTLNTIGLLKTKNYKIPFHIHSLDVIICPYNLGFLTIRTDINNCSFSHSVDFVDCLHNLNPHIPRYEIEMEGNVYSTLVTFLFESLLPQLHNFFNNDKVSFLETDTMFVQSLIWIDSDKIDPVDLYRSGTLCGLNTNGQPFVDANNLDYIYNYLKGNCYNRFAPTTNYMFQEHSLSCISIESNTEPSLLTSQFYGFIYYAVVTNLFHKVVLLKIAGIYSSINLEQDKKEKEKLLYMINSFTSNYFFTIYPVHAMGKDFFTQLRKCFSIDALYTNTKDILFSLVKAEENKVAKKDSLLLLILTLYTVICGIFSMNLFTHDLIGKIKWSHFKSYNPFEYLAVFIVFSGIIVVGTLGIQGLYQGYQDRRNKKKWVQSLLSTKK